MIPRQGESTCDDTSCFGLGRGVTRVMKGGYLECNNGIGGFHQNIVTFERTDLTLVLWGSKDAP